MKVICIYLLMGGLLAACPSNQRAVVGNKNPDAISYNLTTLQVASLEGLNEGEQMLLTRLIKQQNISFSYLTTCLLRHHLLSHPEIKVEEVQKWIATITPADNATMERSSVKISYEKAISEQLNRPLIMNVEANNIVDVKTQAKLQDYSGTFLYELVRRQMGADPFEAQAEVVIFEPGHMLPGYLFAKDGEYYLIGIETTQGGGARRLFGKLKELDTSHVRVVDAGLWALIEMLRDNIANPKEVVQEILDQTAYRYGFKAAKIPEASASQVTSRRLNRSLFAFGDAAVPEGDQTRPVIDDGSKSDADWTQKP